MLGTFEWRMDIQEDDWTDFMDLVRDYLEENINENNNGNRMVLLYADSHCIGE
jgi:hypothetical protein